MFKKFFYTTVICSLFLVGGCGIETYQSSDLPSQKRLDIAKVGFDKAKLVELLGQPAYQTNLMGEEIYVYYRSIKKSRVFFAPKEVERDIYVYTFNQAGIVQDIQHLTLEDGQNVSFDNSVTSVKGKDLSVLEQLVKNFGRYDAGGRDSSRRY